MTAMTVPIIQHSNTLPFEPFDIVVEAQTYRQARSIVVMGNNPRPEFSTAFTLAYEAKNVPLWRRICPTETDIIYGKTF